MISKLERLLSGGTVTWDRLLVTDGLSPEAVEQITAVSPAAPDRVWVVIDHDTPAGSVAVAEKQKALLDWARQTGAVFRSGRGIGYALLLESGLREGEIVLSGGAHAAAVGAAGAVGLSLPPAELAGALESGQISLSPAPPLRLAVTGPLSPYLSVRDLAWTLIRSGQCSGKAVVIRAPQLTAAQAMDLCGLLGAAGAVTALCVREDFPADEKVDLTALQPMAAPPGDAARVVPAGETDGLRVNQVFIGGCGGGSLAPRRRRGSGSPASGPVCHDAYGPAYGSAATIKIRWGVYEGHPATGSVHFGACAAFRLRREGIGQRGGGHGLSDKAPFRQGLRLYGGDHGGLRGPELFLYRGVRRGSGRESALFRDGPGDHRRDLRPGGGPGRQADL